MTLGLRCDRCKKAMFYMRKKPELGNIIRASDCFITKTDIEKVLKPHEKIRCQYCGDVLMLSMIPLSRVREFDEGSGDEV